MEGIKRYFHRRKQKILIPVIRYITNYSLIFLVCKQVYEHEKVE